MVKHVRILLVLLLAAVLTPVGWSAQAGTDVPPGQTGFEPHVAAVNPRNPSQVAVMRGCQVRISTDFGQTFPIVRNTTLGCNGDPSIAWDSQGRLFVTHLDRIGAGNELSVFAGQVPDTTTTGTLTYTPVQVSTINTFDDDKQWLVADSDPNSPFADNLYLVWTEFTGATRVMFSRSVDGGVNWSAPAQVSQGGEGFVWPSHAAVGSNGDVYLAYHTDTCGAANSGTIQLLRDGTGGAAFAAGAVPQRSAAFTAGEATVTCNVQDGSGDEIPGADFWLQGTMQPWILPDPARAGHVYVVGNDDPNDAYANGDDADIVIARSTDSGVSFAVEQVDHGTANSVAVMPSAHIDQDGRITVTWYDNRRLLMNTGANANFGTGNFLLDLYATASVDGGASFAEDFRINDAPFDPDVNAPCRFGSLAGNNCTMRIGEYNGVWTVDGIGYAVWTGNATPPALPFPADGAGAQTTLFDTYSMIGAFGDQFEPNESRDFAVVAALGSDNAYNQERLTLHKDTDVDFFKVLANQTGELEVEAAFNEVIGALRVRAEDEWGNLVATGSTTAAQVGSSVNAFAIPVVEGGTYFIQVDDPAAPGTFPAQNVYDLTIVNRAAPVPFGLDLQTSSDSGALDDDDLTNDATPTLRLRVDATGLEASGIGFSPTANPTLTDDAPGYKVRVYVDGNPAGFADPVAGAPGTFEITMLSPVPDGDHLVTSRVVIVDPSDTPTAGVTHLVGTGAESAALTIRVDTAAPAQPGTPDLLTSSDNAGVNIDDITTLQAPAFRGGAEPRSLVRLLANGDVVGAAVAGTQGQWEITSEPLGDAVYEIVATAEDAAGNTSTASAGLTVIVAHETLHLTGTFAATGDVTVDLEAQTLAPFPVPGGVAGIQGIPTVNFDAAGHAVAVLGTSEDDALTFTPTAGDSGRLTRAGTNQLLRMSGVAGDLLVDPVAGTDAVGIVGTGAADQIVGLVDATSSLTVGTWKTLQVVTVSTENIQVAAGSGQDVVSVTALDTTNAHLIVDGAEPTAAPKKVGDSLDAIAGSPRPRLSNAPGGPSPGSGVAMVSYPQTTGNATRIDYAGIERVRLMK
jgi:hypothetical protein